MFPDISGSTQAFLASLDTTQMQMQQAQSEVSSGLRVQQASDDPTEIAEILQLHGDISQNQQIQSNLNSVSSELSTADSALQTAVQAVESATSLGTQGATSTATADQRTILAQQVAGILQTLVGIANTSTDGRYIFSGDQDTQPAYQLDPTQPEGVKQLVSAPATRVIVDASGTSISVSKTAQEIFDAQDANGQPTAGNVFAAVNALATALQNNDQAGISQAVISLQSADQYLNDQLAFYGQAETSISTATSVAQQFQTQETSNLSQLRDADVAKVAVQLNQEQVQNQAALSAESTLLQRRDLFSYIG
jgi:flagellar hook-associated protein 3 FlgL